MSNSQPEESIGFLISDVSRLLRRNFDKRAQKIGLSRAQWQVLAWLKRNEGISQTQLADLLEMSPMTLVRLIDRLEMNGLVERRADQADGRRSFLARTPAGVEVTEQVHSFRRRLIGSALSSWDNRDVSDFARLLDRFITDFASVTR